MERGIWNDLSFFILGAVVGSPQPFLEHYPVQLGFTFYSSISSVAENSHSSNNRLITG